MTDTERIMVTTVNRKVIVLKMTETLSKYNVGELMEFGKLYIVQAKSKRHLVLSLVG